MLGRSNRDFIGPMDGSERGESTLDWGGPEGGFTPCYRFYYCTEEIYSRSRGISLISNGIGESRCRTNERILPTTESSF